MDAQPIIQALQTEGFRITKARALTIAIFQSHHLPITELELRRQLAKKGIRVNKSTVYRELEFLLSREIVIEVNFGDGKKRYELNGRHHHHIICTNCKKVDDIHIANDLSAVEKKIQKQKKFKVQSHALEFFGLCSSCVKLR